jgi:hypothetical protein
MIQERALVEQTIKMDAVTLILEKEAVHAGASHDGDTVEIVSQFRMFVQKSLSLHLRYVKIGELLLLEKG